LNPRTPTGRDPESCLSESTQYNREISNLRNENIYQEAIIDYQKYREEFIEWIKKESPSTAKEYIRHLDKLIGDKKINTPHELAEIFEDKSKNAKVAIRNFMRFLIRKGYRTKSQLIDFQEVIKVPKSGVRDPDKAFTTTEKILEALEHVKGDEVRTTMIKLLAFTGLRLREAVALLNDFDEKNLEIVGKVARYKLHKVGKSKKAFYAFMPAEFAKKLKRMKVTESMFKGDRLAGGIILPNMLRKWNANFLKSQGISEVDIDFIQGRTPEKIIAKHYLMLLDTATKLYEKVVDKFPIPP